MSVSDSKPLDPNPACQGGECGADALGCLNWQVLSIRFDSDVFAADFGGWIEKDLAIMETRLNQFATRSPAPRQGR